MTKAAHSGLGDAAAARRHAASSGVARILTSSTVDANDPRSIARSRASAAVQSPSGARFSLTDRNFMSARTSVARSSSTARLRGPASDDSAGPSGRLIASGVRGEASCPARMRAETSGAIPWVGYSPRGSVAAARDTPRDGDMTLLGRVERRLPTPRKFSRHSCRVQQTLRRPKCYVSWVFVHTTLTTNIHHSPNLCACDKEKRGENKMRIRPFIYTRGVFPNQAFVGQRRERNHGDPQADDV